MIIRPTLDSSWSRSALAGLLLPVASLCLLGCGSDSTGTGGADAGAVVADAGDPPPRDPNLSGRYGPADDLASCSSGYQWNGGLAESQQMQPGNDCIDCHTSMGRGPRFSIAGTVMGSINDASLCAGVGGIVVELTDSMGAKVSMTTNAAGNFFSTNVLSPPYTAKLTDAEGNERAMLTPQTETDCASCHTDMGLNGAPGRILAP